MAKVNLNEQSAEFSGMVPPHFGEVCKFKVRSVKFGPSNSTQLNMFTFELDLIAPLECKIGGDTYTGLDKKPFLMYISLYKNGIKDLSGIKSFHNAIKRSDLNDAFDDEVPDLAPYDNMGFNIWVETQQKKAMEYNPKSGKKDLVKLDDNKKPIYLGWEWSVQSSNVRGLVDLSATSGKSAF